MPIRRKTIDQIQSNLVRTSHPFDYAVRFLDADAGNGLKKIASCHNAHLKKHGLSKPSKADLPASTEICYLYFLPFAKLIHLEKHLPEETVGEPWKPGRGLLVLTDEVRQSGIRG